MDYESYRKQNFVQPAPVPAFDFVGMNGVTLYFEQYDKAVAYYSQVLGPPAYVEGASTRGWTIGGGWLTLLRGKDGNPRNLEVQFYVNSSAEADRLWAAFITYGGEGDEPVDALMYEPVRYCAVRDPFGVTLVVVAKLNEDS